jgi:hypothetical protein
MYKFSDKTKEILYANGWSEERKVDIEKYKAFYAEHNQPTSDVIFEFLESFADLRIDAPESSVPNFHELLFDIYPSRVPENAYWYITEPICSVGTANDTDCFAISLTGVVYTIFDRHVHKVADSVIEAVEVLCKQDRSGYKNLHKIK